MNESTKTYIISKCIYKPTCLLIHVYVPYIHISKPSLRSEVTTYTSSHSGKKVRGTPSARHKHTADRCYLGLPGRISGHSWLVNVLQSDQACRGVGYVCVYKCRPWSSEVLEQRGAGLAAGQGRGNCMDWKGCGVGHAVLSSGFFLPAWEVGAEVQVYEALLEIQRP